MRLCQTLCLFWKCSHCERGPGISSCHPGFRSLLFSLGRRQGHKGLNWGLGDVTLTPEGASHTMENGRPGHVRWSLLSLCSFPAVTHPISPACDSSGSIRSSDCPGWVGGDIISLLLKHLHCPNRLGPGILLHSGVTSACISVIHLFWIWCHTWWYSGEPKWC